MVAPVKSPGGMRRRKNERARDLCVSGTGNTYRCASALRDCLSVLGRETSLHRVENGGSVTEKELVLCYPVHGFNAPQIMVRFCKKLQNGTGNIWFLKTSGEPLRLNDSSSSQMTRILKKKGYSVKGEFHYVMPYNMIFRHSDEMAALMWRTAQDRIPDAVQQIATGRGHPAKPGPGARTMAGLCRIEHGFFPVNGRLFSVDRKRCTGCMKCVSDCPVGNFRCEDGKFPFGGNCTGCMRCSFDCHAGAIHIGILDVMRVNGLYDFETDPEGAELGRYCRKAYKRYFRAGNRSDT